MASFKDWLTVTWAQGGMQLQPGAGDDADIKARCGRAGSLAATPGEKLLELLRPSAGAPRRHSTAACAPAQPPRPSGFVYCPSDALPYCPPSRLAPARPILKLQPPPQIIQPVVVPPPPVPQRSAPPAPLPVPPPAPPRRSSPQPPRRLPPPTPPRPAPTSPATDPNGNKRTAAVSPQPRLDCNRNPQPQVPRRPLKSLPDTPYTPAPIPTQNQTMKRSPSSGSNISVRQDSNVSSDSFSQTSSPSYTTKTMEAPLLPHQHVNKSLNAKIARGLLLKEQQEKEAGNSSITKSMSTPASLQTIVRFQNGSNMSLQHRVLVAIKFMAGGSYQREVGQDHNLCVAQRTASKYLGQVVAAINRSLKPIWIAFPGTERERRDVAAAFQHKYGLPYLLGTLDCTHVGIFPPRRPHGLQFINRKGKHTINVQLIADVNCRLLHVNAQYPGRVHDQFIFNHSVIKNEMRHLYDQRIGSYYLLGDSGYGLEPWVMTPVLDAAPGSAEERYTEWHCRVRNIIERTNGYLKGTLRCLGSDRILHYKPEMACRIIYACCTIYNIMKHFRVEMDEGQEIEQVLDHYRPEPMQQAALYQAALNRRRQIIDTYFA